MSRPTHERFRPNRRLAAGLTVVVGALATIVVASAAASNIQGSAKPETLRGTAKADKLYGKGGNDKLFGLGGADYLNGGPGNDVLTGGPGADVLVCGPGKDTAAADAGDKIAADCETVTGLPKPALSVAGASMPEGNSGSSALTFTVTLAKATPQKVGVTYATADGTAAAGSDYTASSGSLTFAPGEASKTISVAVIGDTTREPDETFSVALSAPTNAVLGTASATGTIANDDVAVPITPGSYKGATQDGNYVFFTVTPNRTVTGFRINDLTNTCSGGGEITGGVDWSDSTFPIREDGSFQAEGSWSGSQVSGDTEWTGWSANVGGRFDSPTSMTGTVIENNELNYKGTHYSCSSGQKAWSAKLQ
jgi:Calx-beta domain/RTX calcium-binding nonapeptide repeat (4 copies)